MKARHWSWWFLSQEELKAACDKAGWKQELTEKQKDEVARSLKGLIELTCPSWPIWIEQVVKGVLEGRKFRWRVSAER